jgi:hypothetical protein
MSAIEDRIGKLLALADSPNENEAAAAAEKAQPLMLRYGSCGHEWKTAVATRSGGDSGCPCGLKRRARTQSEVEPARSLAVKHPEIAAELHPRGIMDVGITCLVSVMLSSPPGGGRVRYVSQP